MSFHGSTVPVRRREHVSENLMAFAGPEATMVRKVTCIRFTAVGVSRRLTALAVPTGSTTVASVDVGGALPCFALSPAMATCITHGGTCRGTSVGLAGAGGSTTAVVGIWAARVLPCFTLSPTMTPCTSHWSSWSIVGLACTSWRGGTVHTASATAGFVPETLG